jgi:hypothetical protein
MKGSLILSMLADDPGKELLLTLISVSRDQAQPSEIQGHLDKIFFSSFLKRYANGSGGHQRCIECLNERADELLR